MGTDVNIITDAVAGGAAVLGDRVTAHGHPGRREAPDHPGLHALVHETDLNLPDPDAMPPPRKAMAGAKGRVKVRARMTSAGNGMRQASAALGITVSSSMGK